MVVVPLLRIWSLQHLVFSNFWHILQNMQEIKCHLWKSERKWSPWINSHGVPSHKLYQETCNDVIQWFTVWPPTNDVIGGNSWRWLVKTSAKDFSMSNQERPKVFEEWEKFNVMSVLREELYIVQICRSKLRHVSKFIFWTGLRCRFI